MPRYNKRPSRYRNRSRTSRRYGRRRGAGPFPRFRNNNSKYRRSQNLSMLTVWFKRVMPLGSDIAGEIRARVNGQTLTTTGGGPGLAHFAQYGQLYEEYKVVKIIAKLFPSNVGGESLVGPPPGPPAGIIPIFQRGNIVTWIDNKNNDPNPAGIPDIISKGSARMHNPRHTIKRWINRPKGFPTWGLLNPAGIVTTVDPFNSSIRIFGNQFTIGGPGPGNESAGPFFYGIVYWKVIFRGRQE